MSGAKFSHDKLEALAAVAADDAKFYRTLKIIVAAVVAYVVVGFFVHAYVSQRPTKVPPDYESWAPPMARASMWARTEDYNALYAGFWWPLYGIQKLAEACTAPSRSGEMK